jgi:membrane-associated phospholipid phosphatase
MSDHEYLTDVLTGAAVGWVSGYILPWLLHYQGGARPELRAPIAVIPAPMLGEDRIGVTAAGWF